MTSQTETNNLEQYRNEDLLEAVDLFVNAARNLHKLKNRIQKSCNHEHAIQLTPFQQNHPPTRICLNCGISEDAFFEVLGKSKVYKVFSQEEKDEFWKYKY